MEGQLKNGTIMVSESGNRYTVSKLLGAGGQGEVYLVANEKGTYALKWYYQKSATINQKKILDNLIDKGSPSGDFLWPEDIIFKGFGKPFGYIMALRPSEYRSIVDLMKRRVEPSFYNLCKAAFNLTKGYQILHEGGYSYRDISFGNVFFNPDNGKILICDNDNVSVNGADDSAVYGTPRFMAPEIVIGEAKPSRNTDLFSLAVLLFYMLMLNHPLEGKLEANIKCMDVFAMRKLYGTDPVFIFDPDNTTNRPVVGYQDNAIIYWNLYPEKIKKLFVRTFTKGIVNPAMRVTENKWLETFADMMGGMFKCPECGAELFRDEGTSCKCWNCEKDVLFPTAIEIDKYKLSICKGKKIYSHYVSEDGDMEKVIASVSVNPNNPNQMGLKNETDSSWIYYRNDGSQIYIEPGRSAAAVPGTKIDFGNATGIFR